MAGTGSSSDEALLRALLARGSELLDQGRLAESSAVFQEAADSCSGSAPAQHRLGTALAEIGRWKEAAAAFAAAAKLEPDRAELQRELGDASAQLGQWKTALQSYERAIREDPNDQHLYAKLGHMLRLRGHDEKAAAAYRRAVDLGWGENSEQARVDRPGADSGELYLELLKRCLTFLLWDAKDGPLLELQIGRPIESIAHLLRRLVRRLRPASQNVREFGLDWPAMALTMVGKARLDNVQHCVESVLREEVPGDLIEAGTWRGGVPILMRAILKAHADEDRTVWVADSFEGLPKPNPKDYPADRGFDLSIWKSLAVSQEEVRANFERFGLLDDQVKFLEGWFKDTLPQAPIDKLAILRLDGDLYESTMDGLVHLYPRLSPGGYAIIDDYGSALPCQKAVDDYRTRHGISDEIVPVDWSGAYWRRS